MQSSGGLCRRRDRLAQCMQMLESGPAGGRRRHHRAVPRRSGAATPSPSTWAARRRRPRSSGTGLPLWPATTSSAATTTGCRSASRCLDIKEVGTGGGSVAWLDDAGGVHVGPRSAGAEPGPACYGARRHAADGHRRRRSCSGTSRPTRFLAGGMRLDPAAADRALRAAWRRPLGLDVAAAAAGGSRDRGRRPWPTRSARSPPSAGWTRATSRWSPTAAPARCTPSRWRASSAITDVVIPPTPGDVLRLRHADGRPAARLRADLPYGPLTPEAYAAVEADFAALETEARAGLDAQRARTAEIRFLRAVDMRYVGPGAHGDPARARDPGGHRRRRGCGDPGAGLRRRARRSATATAPPENPARSSACASRSSGILAKPDLAEIPAGPARPQPQALTRTAPRRLRPGGRPGRRRGLRPRRAAGRQRGRRPGRDRGAGSPPCCCGPATGSASTTSATSSSASEHPRDRHRRARRGARPAPGRPAGPGRPDHRRDHPQRRSSRSPRR